MATLPSDDEKVRMVLDIFKHFKTRGGEGLRTNNFVAMAAKFGWRTGDIADGLELAGAKGLVEEGPNGAILLTDTGFAQV